MNPAESNPSSVDANGGNGPMPTSGDNGPVDDGSNSPCEPWCGLLEKAQQFATTPVSSPALPNPPKKKLLAGETEQPLPFEIDQINFSIFGKAAVSVFNAPSDGDPDGILGPPMDQVPDAPFAIGRLIDFQPGEAWLKYDLEAGAKTHIDLSDAGFDFKAEGGVRHVAYLRHSQSESLLRGIQTDLQRRPFIFSEDDLQGLEAGEALALFAHGKINATLEFKWSDLLTTGIGTLGRLLPNSNEVFNIKVEAGVSAKVKVDITDVFEVVIARADDDHFKVAVRKAEGSALAAGLTASVGAQFSDPDAVKTVLQQAADGLLGTSLKEIKQILDSVTSLGDLQGDEKKLVEFVLQRLDLDGIGDDAAALKKELEDFEKKVASTIAEIATTKAELSVSYDYQRVSSEDEVLVAKLETNALGTYHRDLVRGRTQKLLDDANGSAPSITLERFLFQKSLEVERSWGFSLGFGKWFKISGRDTAELENIKRRNADGDIQRTFLGSRGYKAKWFGSQYFWDVDFNASMPKYVQPPVRANAFDYCLQLLMDDTQKTVRKSEVPKLLDRAVLWGAIPLSELDSEIDRVTALVGRRKDVTFTYQLKLDSTAFKTILADLAVSNPRAFGRALGEAMPWAASDRENPRIRRNLYGDIWRFYLENPQISLSDLKAFAADQLRRRGHGNLALLEETLKPSSLSRLAQINSKTRDQWRDFVLGASILHGAIKQAEHFDEIRRAFKKLRRIWTQSHHVWALGTHLRDLTSRRPELDEHVDRIVSITYTNDAGKEIVEHIGNSGPLPMEDGV